MVMMYVLIEAGEVIDGPRALPRDWRHVSSLDGLSEEELAPLGWYPCPGEPPDYDPAWQTRSGPVAVADGAGWRAEWTVAGRALEEVQAARLEAVRAEAGRRILAVAPEFRQRNLTARAVEIVMEHGADPADWPGEVQAEVAAGMAVWAAIKAIRAASDVAEAAILAATTAEDAGTVTADWPE